MENSKKRIEQLEKIIEQANIDYYQKSNPTLSDYEFDKLYDELFTLTNGTSPVLNKVNGNVDENEEKVVHAYPMLSLSKTKSVDELKDFIKEQAAVLSYKLDGLTIVAYYKNHVLDKIATRGNGEIGENITRNINLFNFIPQVLPSSSPSDLVVRGEGVMSYTKFEELNSIEGGKFKNARNLSSGLTRSKTSKYEKVIDFIAYDTNESLPQFSDTLENLNTYGFKVVDHVILNKDNLKQKIEKEFTAENIIYPVDGLVLRINNNEYASKLTSSSNVSNHSMAFKWKDETAMTKLLSIEWSISRNGTLTPVAIFEPVELEGTTVTRASLHNVSIFNELKLGLGDTLEVYKANMVIPQILKNHTESNNIETPKTCPYCDTPLEIKKSHSSDVLTLQCTNNQCKEQNVQKIAFFSSKEGLDIQGLSEQSVKLLIDAGVLNNIEDLFKLESNKEIIVKLPLFGEKSYTNLISNIEKAKSVTADKFIRAFGIDLIGTRLTKKVFSGRSDKETIIDFLNSSKETLMNQYGLGDVASDNIVSYPHKSDILNLLDYVNIIPYGNNKKGNLLDNKNFVVTGKLFEVSRKELEELIISNGGNMQSSVNNKTTYLINNDNTSNSSKNKKAKELHVTIITEEELLKMIKGE